MAKNEALNKKIRSEQELPEELSWNTMEQGIIQRMPMKPVSIISAPPSHRRIAKVGAVFLLIAMMVGLVIVKQINRLESNDPSQSVHIATSEKNLELSQVKESTRQLIVDLENEENEKGEVMKNESEKNTNVNDVTSVSPGSASATKERINDNLIAVDKKILPNKTSQNSEETVIKKVEVQQIKSSVINKSYPLVNNQATKKTSKDLDSKIEIPQTLNQKSYTQSSINALPAANQNSESVLIKEISQSIVLTKLAKLDRLYATLDNNREVVTLPTFMSVEALSVTPSVEPLGKANKWALELGLGSTYWLANNRGGELATAKRNHEKTLVSFGSSLSLSYAINDEWSVSSGIGYQRMESLLDYQVQFDTTVTGNLVISRGTATRTVKWNNKFTSYNVPLMLHKSWTTNQLEFVIGAGVSYRFNVQNSGRMLATGDEDSLTIISLEDVDSLKASSWNANAQVAVRYDLGSKIYIGMKVDISSVLSKINIEEGLTQRPTWVQSSIMLGCRF